MANIINLDERRLSARKSASSRKAGGAQILFFTGIRYERDPKGQVPDRPRSAGEKPVKRA